MAQEAVSANSYPDTRATSQATLWTASLYVQKHISEVTVSRNELTWTRKEKKEGKSVLMTLIKYVDAVLYDWLNCLMGALV